jgi:acetolactate decarboxylase
MKKYTIFLIAAVLATICIAVSAFIFLPETEPDIDTIYQVSTLNSLMLGVYDGYTTFGELKAHGQMGLGTFDALDGEMIALEGEYYQVKSDGSVSPVDNSMTTPFAVVTWFEPDLELKIAGPENLSALESRIKKTFPSRNLLYAIRIDGNFAAVSARSVPAQEKPYPLLVEVVKNQTIFNYSHLNGTIVGFWMPDYIEGINMPGYHFHIISGDRKMGGHLLDCRIINATVRIDETYGLNLVVPHEGDFLAKNLGADLTDDVAEVEN